MEFLKILLGCIAAAVVYGIIHDQFTARICIQYFTVFHPPVFATQSPTLLGIGWGIIATWWMGAFLGILIAGAERVGSASKLTFSQLLPSIAWLLTFMAVCAVTVGFLGYAFGKMPASSLDAVPGSMDHRCAADWWAHNASYDSGFFGGLALCDHCFEAYTWPKWSDAGGLARESLGDRGDRDTRRSRRTGGTPHYASVSSVS